MILLFLINFNFKIFRICNHFVFKLIGFTKPFKICNCFWWMIGKCWIYKNELFIFFKSRTCEDWVPKRVPSVEENYRQAWVFNIAKNCTNFQQKPVKTFRTRGKFLLLRINYLKSGIVLASSFIWTGSNTTELSALETVRVERGVFLLKNSRSRNLNLRVIVGYK